MFEVDLEELGKVGFYDYASFHYWEMSKEQLADILKEFVFATYKEYGEDATQRIESDAIECLEERWNYDEED